MPNPKLETYKSKKTGVIYDYTDADAQSQLTGIKDGTGIDSFADVESALAGCVDWSSYAKTGVHNLFDSSKAEFKDGGLTCTKNVDGSISIGAGTTTSELNYPNNASYANCYELEPSTKYIFSIGSAITNFRLRVFCKTTSSSDWTIIANDQNVENIHFTTPASFYAIWVRIDCDSNKAISAATLYPMIRLATDTNPAFAPYAMTNRELTDALNTRLFLQSENAAKTVTLKLSNTNQQILALVFSGGWRAAILLTSRSSQSTAYEDNIFTSDNTKSLGAQYVDGNIQITLPTYTNVNLLSAETFTV